MGSYGGYDGGDFSGYQFQSALPFGNSSGAGAIGARSPGQVAGAYQGAYNNALAMNQSNYQNVIGGYQRLLSQQTTAQQAIQSGYRNLYNDVVTRVEGIGRARAEQINRSSAAQLAASSQQLIDRGLGNTTIQSSVNRGVEADRNLAQLQLSDQVAERTAGYMSNLGLAGLSAQERGLNDTNRIGLSQLGFMDSVQARYPDAGMYAQLAQGLGAANQGNRGGGAYGGGSFYGSGAGRGQQLGYVPSQYYSGSGSVPYPVGAYSGGMNSGVNLMAPQTASTAYGGGTFDWGGAAGSIAGGVSGLVQPGYDKPAPTAYDFGGSVASGAGGGIADLGLDYGGGGDF